MQVLGQDQIVQRLLWSPGQCLEPRTLSRRPRFLTPSAMFAGIDTAARRICRGEPEELTPGELFGRFINIEQS